jgi:hypothetical protein
LSAIREIDAHFSVQFEPGLTAGMLVCRAEDGSADLNRLQERAYQALLLIRQLEFDAALPWTNQRLWDWFVGSARGIRFTTVATGIYCCEPASVIVAGVNTNVESAPGFPRSIFGYVHEARHAEGHHPHTCEGTKDNTIAELGAFGVQYYLGVWIAEHAVAPALTAEERQYARVAAQLLRAGGAFCVECGGI